MFPLDRHEQFLVPAEDIEQRVAAFQQRLADADVDLAWIEHPADRTYLSGSVQDGVLLIPASGEPVFFVKLSRQRAETEARVPVHPFPGRRGLLAEVSARLGTSGRLGLALDVLPAATYVWLRDKLCGQFPQCDLADVSGLLRLQKAIKSPWEVTQIRRAAEQANQLFGEIEQHLAAGITELELSARVEARLRRLGHSGTIRVRKPGAALGMIYAVAGDGGLFPTNFDGPVGAEGLYPASTAGAGWREIRPGETVMLDMVTAVNGYHADNARTFSVGDTLADEARAAHQFCKDALEQLEARLKPGGHCAQIFRDVQAWATAQGEPEGFMGFGDNRVKFFGHGVGLELDEFPVLADRIDLELAAGMIVAMEPKAFLPGIGPVGVENTYLVTPEGCTSLCTAERKIISVPGCAT